MRFIHLFLLWIGLFISPLQQSFANPGPSSGPVHVELISEDETIQPGRPLWIALSFKMEEGRHIYWKNPGDAGLPIGVKWNLPTGLKAGSLKWPFPEKFSIDEMVGFGYSKEVVLLSEFLPDSLLKSGEEVEINAFVNWLVCSDSTCEPGSAPVSLKLQVSSQIPALNSQAIKLFKEARDQLPQPDLSVKIIRKQGIVQLQFPPFPSQEQSAISRLNFFPEESGVIDHTIDPVFSSPGQDIQSYIVNLKESDQITNETTYLKGVLVLQTDGTNDRIQAFDVNAFIQHEGKDETLSFIDGIKFGTAGSSPTSVLASHQGSHFDGGLGLALLFAFVGGMILNLMPCVLPVISFKVMSFIKMAGQSRALTLKHGFLFSLGVLFSFWVLAGFMLVLRAYGQAVGWGFQLQEPLFVVILASFLFIFSLSLFGVFELGLFVSSLAGQAEVETTQKSSGYMSSFLSGVLATAVATPCTGPFLGSAVGFAVTLPVFQALLIFTALAVGMCFPYVVLAGFPSLLRLIPKPGAWMETFKHIMGFGLLATVLWLLWVFSAQTNTFSLICLLAGFLSFSIGAWIYGKGSSPLMARSRRLVAYAAVAIFAVIGCQLILWPRASWNEEEFSAKLQQVHEDWEVFSPERIAELQRQGIPILVDFTAKWCLICQANHLVLSGKEVVEQMASAGIVKMKADWTKSDPVITKALSEFGRNSVPLYVLYGTDPSREPIILPQVLTSDTVVQHIKDAIESEHIVLRS